MQRMQAQASADPTEGFFSHEAMRERAPELWERMVGRYLTEEDRRALLGHQYDSFSGMLLSQLLETEEKPDRVAGSSDEEEQEDDDDVSFFTWPKEPRVPQYTLSWLGKALSAYSKVSRE